MHELINSCRWMKADWSVRIQFRASSARPSHSLLFPFWEREGLASRLSQTPIAKRVGLVTSFVTQLRNRYVGLLNASVSVYSLYEDVSRAQSISSGTCSLRRVCMGDRLRWRKCSYTLVSFPDPPTRPDWEGLGTRLATLRNVINS